MSSTMLSRLKASATRRRGRSTDGPLGRDQVETEAGPAPKSFDWSFRPFLLLGYATLAVLVLGLGGWGVYARIAGAVIGTAASTFLPDVEASDDVYAQIAESILPVGISGLVLAAAVAAMMSTASGALIATATVTRTDVKPLLQRLFGRTPDSEREVDDVHSDRRYVVVLGIVVIVIAALLNDVVAALTIAYDILVGGLLVSILGGFLWKRATGTGALWSMAVGTVVTLGTMAIVGDVLFAGSIGRTDFPRGNHADLVRSIRTRLWPLGDDVTFVPGHGPVSTFGDERRSNPFVADHVIDAA